MQSSLGRSSSISNHLNPYREQLSSLALLLVSGTLMGTFLPITKAAIRAGAVAFSYAFWTSLGSGLLVILIARLARSTIRIERGQLFFYLLTGGAGALIQYIGILVVQHIGSGLTGIIVMLAPLVTFAIAAGVRLEPLRLARVCGRALGACGTILIVSPYATLPSSEQLDWLLTGLALPLMAGANLVYRSRAWPRGTDAFSVAGITSLSSAVILFPFAIVDEGLHIIRPITQPVILWVLLHSVLGSLTLILAMWLQRRAGPVFASQCCYVMTLTTMAAGAMFFEEHYSGWIWIGLAFIVVGIAVSSFTASARPGNHNYLIRITRSQALRRKM